MLAAPRSGTHHSILRTLAIGVLAVPAAVACSSSSSDSDPGAEQTSAIVGGTTDTGDPWVVYVVTTLPGGGQEICSGSLIAPNLVLTARHCIDNYARVPVSCSGTASCPMTCASTFTTPLGASPSATAVDTLFTMQWSPRLRAPDGGPLANPPRRSATQIIRAPGTGFCDSDVALLVLSSNVPSSEATPVTPLVNKSMFASSMSFTEIGFGYTSTDAGALFGLREVRQNNPITCIPGDPSRPCTATGAGRYVSPQGEQFGASNFLAGQVACNGDSGGPAVDQGTYSGGKPVVYGITSRAGQGSDQCTFSILNRTDSFSSLIVSGAHTAATLGGYPVPAWALP